MPHYRLPKLTVRPINTLAAALTVLAAACGESDGGEPSESIYRQHMRDLVQGISAYAKGIDPDFLIVPQNGKPLVVGDEDGGEATSHAYLEAIDGIGREAVFCGERRHDERTPSQDTAETIEFLDVAKEADATMLLTDYYSDRELVDESHSKARQKDYLSFVESNGNIDLDAIPPYHERPVDGNSANVTSL
jgi:cysteinyl-tRNA synthetase